MGGVLVLRKVYARGDISFAGSAYRVGNRPRGRQVQVVLQGDTVQVSHAGKLIRTHRARHDPTKEHGAFANPGGKPHRKKAS